MKTLTEVLNEHHIVRSTGGVLAVCDCGDAMDDYAEHVAAVYREARTITTREQLDAMQARTVIRDDDGEIYERDRSGGGDLKWYWPGPVAERVDPELPALVLWLPEDDS